MGRVPSLRASDSEREEVAERLRHATAEGRLTADELDERLGALYTSRTYGELDALVADLPVVRAPDRVGVRFPKRLGAVAALTLLFAILGMLGAAARHSAEAARYRRFQFPGSSIEPRHEFIHAASALGAMAAVGVGLIVLWLVIQSRTQRRS